jgi:putative ABC transport system substrate-binding protein
VIACTTTAITTALQRETKTIPVVFMAVSDPVGSGLVKSLSQPGGNITGFVDLEPSLIEKSLELLAELAPQVTRAAIVFNPDTSPYANVYLSRTKTAAPRLKVKTHVAHVRSEGDIEQTIAALGRERGTGFIVMPDSFMGVHHVATIASAAKHKVPATYFAAPWVASGGLSSYGPDVVDLRRRAAGYVDRILRGAKPAELPVQQPTKFELMVNLKTAQALGLTVPQSVLVRADRVIG